MLFFSVAALAASAATAPMDFSALDDAIERCRRDLVLPVFAAEAQRRSAFLTLAYEEQARISAERLALAGKRRALREAALQPPPKKAAAPEAGESDQDLALAQLALEDRQRALDDRRRLEALRQEAVDTKRQYFLTRCASSRQ